MAYANVDGLRLYFEEVGSGVPLIFLHEFAGDHRSWEGQMQFFGRRYRAITMAARGYLPSDVPESPEDYSQNKAISDVVGFLDALHIEKAHICGLSMGSYTTLLFGLAHPDRAHSLTVAGCGYGSGGARADFHKEVDVIAQRMLDEGMPSVGETYTSGPARVQFQNKDPRSWAIFRDQFSEHSNVGSAHTFRGIQKQRPSVYDVESDLRKLDVPLLILNGDEDEPCLEPGLFLKRCAPRAGLEIFPRTGHMLNLEEPAKFNQAVLDFLTAVESDNWPARDPRSLEGTL